MLRDCVDVSLVLALKVWELEFVEGGLAVDGMVGDEGPSWGAVLGEGRRLGSW